MSTVSEVSAASTASNTSSSNKTLGQDDFLTLLVAQLQNQDPLNPADATEFTAQLAQYSQLEQLFNLNDAMEELTSTTAKSQSISALNLIGQEVVVEGNDFTLESGESVNLGYQVEGTVTGLNFIVKNDSGKTVTTIAAKDLSAGNHFITWNGKDANGNAVPAGDYSFTLGATGGNADTALAPLIRTTVTGVDLNESEPKVVTESGRYTLSTVYGAYEKSST